MIKNHNICIFLLQIYVLIGQTDNIPKHMMKIRGVTYTYIESIKPDTMKITQISIKIT